MKMSTFLRAVLIAFCILFLLVSGSVWAEFEDTALDPTATDTAFTYQGRLAQGWRSH